MFERKYFIDSRGGADNMINYLSGILHDARSTTYRYIRGIKQDELDWQPFEGWNTVGEMLSHIIAVENFFRIKYLEKRELSESEKAIIPALEPGKNVSRLMGKPLNYYKRELAISHKAMLKALKNMTNQKLLEARYDIYDYVNGCNLAWILYHGAEDEVYHRGQISLLRKLYQKMKGNK